ncbi:MAG: (2Fe-2S)-binding protein [Deltaproteobacteria bacterium]|nr:(2Fe-2S)-binding protein [Deltaproteobacteria bacterium]
MADAPKPTSVKLTVDGKPVEVKPGTNLIEAAKQAGAQIPYYCYHPRLTIAANCRMCLVEVSNAPKLVPGCQTPVAENLAVQTRSARVKDAQRAVLEFLLLNHPVDCSICDQAGECKLEDYYMMYDFKPSRLEGGKVLKNKRKVLGPLVVIDQERCILCTRCVRFMEEVAQDRQLGVFGRGSHEVVDIFPNKPLDSNYAGNTVDICPVGALLSRDFRFKARSWFLSATPSVCTGCSRGCNTYADWFNGVTYRYRPRENEAVNKSWMCDQGRLSYKSLNADRVEDARLGKKAEGKTAVFEQAVASAAEKLKVGAANLGFLASPVASVEDLLAGFALAKQLGLKTVFVGGRADGASDKILMQADKNPNRTGLTQIAKANGFEVKPFSALVDDINGGKVRSVYAVGGEVPVGARDAGVVFSKLELFVASATNHSELTDEAHVLLPAATHVEDHGTFVNFEGRAQRFVKCYPAPGNAKPHWQWASAISRTLGGEAAFKTAAEVFAALSTIVPELKDFDWQKAQPRATARKGSLHPLSAGGDGRPAGYREWMEAR